MLDGHVLKHALLMVNSPTELLAAHYLGPVVLDDLLAEHANLLV